MLSCGYLVVVASETINITKIPLHSRDAFRLMVLTGMSGDVISIESITLGGLQKHLPLLTQWEIQVLTLEVLYQETVSKLHA